MGEGGRRARRPPFASGDIAGDYEPLFAYWEEARAAGDEEAVERATLSREDFDELERRVEEAGRLSLEELLDELRRRFEGRVDAEIARRAYERVGLRLDAEHARRLIAGLLAAWLVEAGEHWGMLRLTGPLSRGGSRGQQRREPS